MTKSREKHNFFYYFTAPVTRFPWQHAHRFLSGNSVGSFSREMMVLTLAQLSEMFTLSSLMLRKISFFVAQCR